MTMTANRWEALTPYQPLKPADRPHRLNLTVKEVVDGEAIAACPHCSSTLVIDVPAYKAMLGGVVELSLPEPLLMALTQTEGRLVAVLYAAQGQWVHVTTLLRRVWGPHYVEDSDHAPGHLVRVNFSRMRSKIAALGWRIDCARGRGLYRLVKVDGDA